MSLGLLAAAVAGAWAASAAPAPKSCRESVIRRSKPMMATYVTITARGCDERALEEGVRASFQEMERLAGILSEWNPDSPVSRVSDQAGVAPVAVPVELLDVLGVSQSAAALTSGAFDVTWAALGGLWHFEGSPALPDPAAVARQRALVDYRELQVDLPRRTAFLRRKGMRLGLGGVAKGFIAAAGAEALVDRGIRDVLVAASGDIAARGRDGERPWRVAIQDPRHGGRTLASVELRDESISTAGDYEHCFFIGGRRYHHILDPKTGYPAASGTASVSVLSSSGALADALDTGLLVMGTRAGVELADRLPRLGALFVDEDGDLRAAGPLADRFEIAAHRSLLRPDTNAGAGIH